MKQQEYAIEVRNVKKKFKIYFDKGKMLKEKILFANRNRFEEKWVLNGISFNVRKGEAVGLIGHNGCGKSTTLKLLTKIMYPEAGEIIMHGRVSSLIELGAGFHPDMSGRENIYINASIFGLNKAEIDRRIQDIIDFSELEDYIDNPVRTYSSGMYMRLAFSIAINVDADILLIDEILAVGDVNFQDKCFKKLLGIKEQGTTIVLVSHSMSQIESICDRSIWIHQGLLKAEGPAEEVDAQYLEYMSELRREKIKTLSNSGQKEKEENNELEYLEEQAALEAGTYDAIFDATFYYNNNKDVATLHGKDPAALLAHFLRNGMKEGRQGNSEFSLHIYKSNYSYLVEEYGEDSEKYYLHYLNQGKACGMVADKFVLKETADYSDVFQADYYLEKYEDLKAICGNDKELAKKHFLEVGMQEGRQGCADFNPRVYRNNYFDLNRLIGMDMRQYYIHYMLIGKAEGRTGKEALIK